MTTHRSISVRGMIVFVLFVLLLAQPMLHAADSLPPVAKPNVNAAVTITDNGDTWTMDNGIIKANIIKANGNMQTVTGAQTASMTWTAFNLPDTLTQGGTSSAFAYDADQHRTHQTRGDGSKLAYIGDDWERDINGSTTTDSFYLFTPLGRTVELVYVNGAASATRYYLTDHLGSVDTVVTGSSIASPERLSYDAWGVRRLSDWTTGTVTTTIRHGFTDHEMLDGLGLVHMNGRIYNPALGRFLSADPINQDIYNTQTYNAYSYVLNNPLSYKDPTGMATEAAASQSSFWSTISSAWSWFTGLFTSSSSAGASKGTISPVPSTLASNALTNNSFQTGIAASDGNVIDRYDPNRFYNDGQSFKKYGHIYKIKHWHIEFDSGRYVTDVIEQDTGRVFKAWAAEHGDPSEGAEIALKFVGRLGLAAGMFGTPNPAVLSARTAQAGATVAAEDAVAAEGESALLQPYGGPGGGHHIPAKRAFSGAAGYDAEAALAVPNAELSRLGVSHSAVTGAQATLYRAFARTGAPLTWESMAQIETQALIRGGMQSGTARATVDAAVKVLQESGVSSPVRIPWGGK